MVDVEPPAPSVVLELDDVTVLPSGIPVLELAVVEVTVAPVVVTVPVVVVALLELD